jgi:hypothetical protein
MYQSGTHQHSHECGWRCNNNKPPILQCMNHAKPEPRQQQYRPKGVLTNQHTMCHRSHKTGKDKTRQVVAPKSSAVWGALDAHHHGLPPAKDLICGSTIDRQTRIKWWTMVSTSQPASQPARHCSCKLVTQESNHSCRGDAMPVDRQLRTRGPRAQPQVTARLRSMRPIDHSKTMCPDQKQTDSDLSTTATPYHNHNSQATSETAQVQ